MYDAENRIDSVETSHDSLYWEKDADYEYYRHGPLARRVLGANQVQGLDYSYTLQGWLKGVNSTAVLPASGAAGGGFDMGGGGANTTTPARDAFGFSLNYFNSANGGDYKPIGTGVTPFATVTELLPAMADGVQTGRNLYNGNIRAMVVNIPQLVTAAGVYGYRYDQLNRIKAMNSFNGFANATNTLTPLAVLDYRERVSYDPNGNIQTYNRSGDAARFSMDSMTYTYKANNNQLDKVADAATDASIAQYPNYNDIKQGQATGNYQYDAIGNLISDAAEGITNISWSVYGKIQSITKTINAVTTVINYGYDASGNRISKTVTVGGTTTNTIYVRDASGNTMAVYTKDAAINSGAFTQTEISLYGSSRLGVWNINRNLTTLTSIDYSNYRGSFTRGNKLFELANHLGNVLVTVSDKKIGVDVAPQNGIIDYSVAEVVTANDYYPFGMTMPGRKYSSSSSSYRYGFNGKENDAETNTQDYGLRIYDPRLGRFLSVDPLDEDYPELTPYQFASNRPIDGIDLDGAEWTSAELTEILSKAKAALGTMISENTIVLQGVSNAIVNANLLGVPDKLGSWGTDNLDDYSTDYNQKLYLWGRVVGDVAAALQGLAEVSGGSAAVGGGLAVSTTGVGAVAGLPTAIVGGLVTGHGVGTGAAAAVDLGQTLGQLQQLGAYSTGSSDAGKKTPEQTTNQQATSAQNKNPGAAQSNTSSNGNSASSSKSQKGYRIKNNETGKYVKPGISGGKVRKDGVPYRGVNQANRWNKSTGRGTYSAEPAKSFRAGRGARQRALNWETKEAARLKKQGHLQEPDKHKRPL